MELLLAEFIKFQETPAQKETKMKNSFDIFTCPQLKGLCSLFELPVSGTKIELSIKLQNIVNIDNLLSKMKEVLDTKTKVSLVTVCEYLNIKKTGTRDVLSKLIYKTIEDASMKTKSSETVIKTNISETKSEKSEKIENDKKKPIKKEKKIKSEKRKTITAMERQQIWNCHIGITHGQINCPYCQINPITQLLFEIGHVIAHSKGGQLSPDNVRPLCGLCNKSMGSNTLDINKWKIGYDKVIQLNNQEKIALQHRIEELEKTIKEKDELIKIMSEYSQKM